MKPHQVVKSGAILAALGIAAGAFGAHGLKGKVEPKDLETFEIAVRYQMYHALGLLAVGAWFGAVARLPKPASAAIGMLIIGTLIFSGTLYGIVVGGPRWLGAITPIGGTLQIIGWAVLAANVKESGGDR